MYTYLTVRDDVIEGKAECRVRREMPVPDGCRLIEVEGEVGAMPGSRLSWLDGRYRLRPVAELVAEGRYAVPEGYRLEGGEVVPMTDEEKVVAGLREPDRGYKVRDGKVVPMTEAEKIAAGIDELPEGHKIVGDSVVAKTPGERLADGEITAGEYNEIQERNRQAEYNDTLSGSNRIAFQYILDGSPETRARWLARVQEIKSKYPKAAASAGEGIGGLHK